MSKITVVTDANGRIAAVAHGHVSFESARKASGGKPQGGLRAGPGQKLHELDLPEDVSQIADWGKLEKKIQPHLH